MLNFVKKKKKNKGNLILSFYIMYRIVTYKHVRTVEVKVLWSGVSTIGINMSIRCDKVIIWIFSIYFLFTLKLITTVFKGSLVFT